MKPNELALAVHHTMTYKVQTHMFSMSHNNLPITRFTVKERRIIQLRTFKQNQLSFPLHWINKYEQNNKPWEVREAPKVDRLKDGIISVSLPKETRPMYPCEKCQIEGKHPMSYSYMPRRSCLARFISVINALENWRRVFEAGF